MEVSTTTASQSRDEFLQLLVAQLRNQDPLQPVKQEDFLAQLAQFSTLEGIEKLNSSFDSQVQLQQDALWMNQLSQASSLIGRDVTYFGADNSQQSGVVESVQISDGSVRVLVDGESIAVDRVTEIRAAESTGATDSSETDSSAESSESPDSTTDAASESESTTPDPSPLDSIQSLLPRLIDGPINTVRRLPVIN